jgi:hypothetical protein
LQAEKFGFTDLDEYCMERKRRGTAIIINNKDFHPATGTNDTCADDALQIIYNILTRLEYTRWN